MSISTSKCCSYLRLVTKILLSALNNLKKISVMLLVSEEQLDTAVFSTKFVLASPVPSHRT